MSHSSGLITSVCLFFCLDFNNPKFSPVCKSLFCLFVFLFDLPNKITFV